MKVLEMNDIERFVFLDIFRWYEFVCKGFKNKGKELLFYKKIVESIEKESESSDGYTIFLSNEDIIELCDFFGDITNCGNYKSYKDTEKSKAINRVYRKLKDLNEEKN